ncbi:unnamed protein product, partial [Cyprideis torosa]
SFYRFRHSQICQFSVFVLCVPSSILSPLKRLFHSKVEAFHHNRLPVFGVASDLNTSLRVAESSQTMEDHQNLEEFRTRVEAESTEAGSGEYGIGEDFHDGEKDLLSSIVTEMEDHQHLEECSTHVEAKSTATDGDTGSRGYEIGEDFHDGEKDLLSSIVTEMEDHQHLEECSTHVEAKSTATDGDTGSRGYEIGEDFHDGEKDLLSSEVLLPPRENEMPPAKQNKMI